MFIIRGLYRKNGNDVANKSILIFVFEKQSNFDTFINSGWELGDQATTAAKMGEEGGGAFAGAMSVSPGVWMYQLTDDGLEVELTVKEQNIIKMKT